jgi:hypothetical protein
VIPTILVLGCIVGVAMSGRPWRALLAVPALGLLWALVVAAIDPAAFPVGFALGAANAAVGVLVGVALGRLAHIVTRRPAN